ncbi:MAG TPA: Smr/MutS family protein, partial [Blastocatellia bacterium]|nr:Smr/MutS family protein [Blastocatellia bacterium]
VGTGTDPEEGAALGVAIVDYFRRAGAAIIATTHYNPLKMWASQTEGVLNASVEFDEQTLRPTYRLLVGVAGASAGIEIARRMDVPEVIIDEARLLLDPAHLQAGEYLRRLKAAMDEQESLRAALEEERQVTAEKYARLDVEFSQREKSRREEFESLLAQTIREFSSESERLIAGLKDRVAAARLRKEAEARAMDLRRQAGVRLRKQVQSAPAPAGAAGGVEPAPEAQPAGLVEEAAEINERDQVRVMSIERDGVVESISGDTYTVLIGSLRFRVKRHELRLLKAASPSPSKRAAALPRGVSASVNVDEDFGAELNIIGTHVDEASDRVDKFLDEAFLAGAESVRIVHGMGKGVLRRAISDLLTGHPHVERFELAAPNQGGAGATIVHLRK